MHRIVLTPAQAEDLRFHLEHSTSSKVRIRCLAILMRGHGLTKAQIESITGAALSSQTNWERQWVKHGLPTLVEVGYLGRQSRFTPSQRRHLSAQFAENPPATLAEARHRVEQATGEKLSLEGVRKFCRDKLKLRRRKAKQVPPRCDDPKKRPSRSIGERIS
jgi:transposase